MEVRLLEDAPEFAALVHDWLAADPFSTTVIGSALSIVLDGTSQPEDALWIAVLDGAEVVGAAIHTPPYHPFLPGLPPGCAAEIAGALWQAGRPVAGALGHVDAVREFTNAWTGRSGERSTVEAEMRLYRLGELAPPDGVTGRPRRAGLTDLDLVVDWYVKFHRESVPHSPADDLAAAAGRSVRAGRVWLWEDEGRPVSVAAHTAAACGVVRVGPVYTPPDHRRRGYGAAVTARATRAALEAGADDVVLYTDLANPISNAIYQRIGYVPHHDAEERRFHR